MPSTITRSNFKKLVGTTTPVAVSIITPTNPAPGDPFHNSIAFKNQVRLVLQNLKNFELSDTTIHTLRKTADAYLSDPVFWKKQKKSFALYVADGFVKSFRLPTITRPVSMIANHFYIRPFLRILDHQAKFYILDLDRDNTKVWRADLHKLIPIKVPDLPKSITQEVGEESSGRELQFHTSTTSPGGGIRPAIFHGSSSWKDDKNRYQERFFRAVDKALNAYLQNHTNPVILAGAESLTTSYRKITQLKNLFNTTLPKIDRHRLSRYDLHGRAKRLISGHLLSLRIHAADKIREAPKIWKKSNALGEIVDAAFMGRIDTLLIARNRRVWRRLGNYRLEVLNLATRLTLESRGRVVVLPRENIPGLTVSAALFRY